MVYKRMICRGSSRGQHILAFFTMFLSHSLAGSLFVRTDRGSETSKSETPEFVDRYYHSHNRPINEAGKMVSG